MKLQREFPVRSRIRTLEVKSREVRRKRASNDRQIRMLRDLIAKSQSETNAMVKEREIAVQRFNAEVVAIRTALALLTQAPRAERAHAIIEVTHTRLAEAANPEVMQFADAAQIESLVDSGANTPINQ
jgi:hypothetical protein